MMKSTAKPFEQQAPSKAKASADPTAVYAPKTDLGKAAMAAVNNINKLAGELRSEAGNHVIVHKHIDDLAGKINEQAEALRAAVIDTEAE